MRIGLIGTGHWAAETQGAALAAHPGVIFAGVWGRDPAKAQALADRYGVPAHGSADALFADVDAVAFAVPPDVQADLALRATQAGKHLLLDKPLALTVEAADRLVDAVEARGLAALVFFTGHFVPSVAGFLADRAAVGGWYAAHGTFYASIYRPGNPYADSVWRKEHGGLWDVGPHALAAVVPLLGPVVEVSAADGPRQTAHLLLRHAGGGASTLSLTLDAAPEATAFSFAYFGEHGTAVLPDYDAPAVDAFAGLIDALLAQVRDGVPGHPCDARFGREVVAVLAAAEVARREHRFVTPAT
jgi:predicted dehydrogenase